MGDSRQLVEVDGRRVRLTNLDKVMYPSTGMTKGEVISYYAEIAGVMLPHVAGRPVTRKRWVHGVGTSDDPQTSFFEKTLDAHAPEWVRRGMIEHRDGPKSYPIVGDRATLVWLAQSAALELHVPQWRFDAHGRPRHPDRLVFDLDPGEDVGLAECAEVARLVRGILEPMGLAPVPVTSGSRGMHLYAALDGSQSSEQASTVAHELARALEADHPDLVVSNMRKAARTGRVLIDWSQNNGKKTTIAPYSLRGRATPTVAVPRTWLELDDAALRQLVWHEVLARVAERGDPLTAITERADAGGGPLDPYLSMRRTDVTPEPMPTSSWGVSSGGTGEPMFVVHEHRARKLHFDLRLERDGVLKSWAVPKGVPEDPGVNHLAVEVEDHPIEYGSFEGSIPKGEYGAGLVTIWDTGRYAVEKWRDDEVIIVATGRPGGPLGTARLALIRTEGAGEKAQWLLHRMKNQTPGTWSHATPLATPIATPLAAPHPAPHPAPVAAPIIARPMLAVNGTPGLLRSEVWSLEYKWDGIRVLARTDGPALRLVTRAGTDVTVRYPELAVVPAMLRGDAVVDGEIVALDERGRPDFGLLQERMHLTKPQEIARGAASVPVRLVLFDVLEIAGSPTIDEPYEQRRERLERLLRESAAGDDDERAPIAVSPRVDSSLDDALAEARRLGLEGVMAKRPDSRYAPGERSDDWVKLKFTSTQEVVIGAYRRGSGARTGRIRSLLVGIPGDETASLDYVGRVGSGLSERAIERLLERLRPLETSANPFAHVPDADITDAVWVRPELVGEIEFAGWARGGSARHARWRGLRVDVTPGDVRRTS